MTSADIARARELIEWLKNGIYSQQGYESIPFCTDNQLSDTARLLGALLENIKPTSNPTKKNEFPIDKILTPGQLKAIPEKVSMNSSARVLFSDEDADLREVYWCWSSSDRYPSITRRWNGRSCQIFAHRVVMMRMIGRALVNGELVDHINHDKLDARRIAIRLVNHSQNMQNLGNFHLRGTTFHKKSKKWIAQVRTRGKHYYLGRFSTQEAAAEAAAKKREELGFMSTIPETTLEYQNKMLRKALEECQRLATSENTGPNGSGHFGIAGVARAALTAHKGK